MVALLLAGPAAGQGSVFLLQKCADPSFLGEDLALDYCDRAIKAGDLSQQSLALAYQLRGSLWTRKAQNARALADFTSAIEHAPNNSSLYILRANVRRAMGDGAGATADLDQALRVEPGQPAAWLARGVARVQEGRHDEAIADLAEALRLYSASRRGQSIEAAAAHFWIGIVHFRKADYAAAIRSCGEAITPELRQPEPFMCRAISYARSQDPDRAIADLTEAVRIAPTDLQARDLRADLYAQKGNVQAALADLDAMLKIASPDLHPSIQAKRANLLQQANAKPAAPR